MQHINLEQLRELVNATRVELNEPVLTPDELQPVIEVLICMCKKQCCEAYVAFKAREADDEAGVVTIDDAWSELSVGINEMVNESVDELARLSSISNNNF